MAACISGHTLYFSDVDSIYFQCCMESAQRSEVNKVTAVNRYPYYAPLTYVLSAQLRHCHGNVVKIEFCPKNAQHIAGFQFRLEQRNISVEPTPGRNCITVNLQRYQLELDKLKQLRISISRSCINLSLPTDDSSFGIESDYCTESGPESCFLNPHLPLFRFITGKVNTT